MTKVSKNNAVDTTEAPAAAPEAQAPQAPIPSHADTLLQLSAQASATKQLADELMNANIGLRSNGMVAQHHLNAATELNQKLEAEKAVMQKEIEALKLQLAEFTKPTEATQDQEAAA
jgi:hypothetical protein